MDWDKILRLVAATFGLLGSAVVAYSIIEVPSESLLPRIMAFHDYNPHLIDVVAREKADKTAGFKLLTVSFLFSTASIFAPKKSRTWLVILLLGISGALLWQIWIQRNESYQETKSMLEKLANESINKVESNKP